MPLYKIAHATETRLVKAASAAAALRHVTTPMFVVTAITDPSDAAEIAGSGVKLETAGDATDVPGNSAQSDAMREMLAETLAGGKNSAAATQ